MWVPQGTILGPLLFLIYVNDLPNCLSSCHPRMYPDDTHITYAGADLSSIQSNLNHDLSNLSKWLTSNKLTLNSTKTEFLFICSRQRLSTLPDTLKLSINNVPINRFDRLQKLQNRAARVLTSSSYDTDAKGLIRQLGWKDFYTQRQIQKSLMVYNL